MYDEDCDFAEVQDRLIIDSNTVNNSVKITEKISIEQNDFKDIKELITKNSKKQNIQDSDIIGLIAFLVEFGGGFDSKLSGKSLYDHFFELNIQEENQVFQEIDEILSKKYDINIPNFQDSALQFNADNRN